MSVQSFVPKVAKAGDRTSRDPGSAPPSRIFAGTCTMSADGVVSWPNITSLKETGECQLVRVFVASSTIFVNGDGKVCENF